MHKFDSNFHFDTLIHVIKAHFNIYESIFSNHSIFLIFSCVLAHEFGAMEHQKKNSEKTL